MFSVEFYVSAAAFHKNFFDFFKKFLKNMHPKRIFRHYMIVRSFSLTSSFDFVPDRQCRHAVSVNTNAKLSDGLFPPISPPERLRFR